MTSPSFTWPGHIQVDLPRAFLLALHHLQKSLLLLLIFSSVSCLSSPLSRLIAPAFLSWRPTGRISWPCPVLLPYYKPRLFQSALSSLAFLGSPTQSFCFFPLSDLSPTSIFSERQGSAYWGGEGGVVSSQGLNAPRSSSTYAEKPLAISSCWRACLCHSILFY